MKILKTIVIPLIMVSVIGVLLGCGDSPDETSEETSIYTVGSGNLSVDISAAGNLDLSHTEDLTAGLFYQEGTIAEVLVETGDSVEEGQVLVKIDEDEWQDELTLLEDELATSQRQVETEQGDLAAAERKVQTQELALVAAQRDVTSKEIALQEAQNDLEDIDEVEELQDKIDYYENLLNYIEEQIAINQTYGEDPDYEGNSSALAKWWSEQDRVEELIVEIQQELMELLNGNSQDVDVDTVLEIKKAMLSLDTASDAVTKANLAVDEAEDSLESAEAAVEYARLDLSDAEENAEEAAEALAEATANSPEVTAPFDGFITEVNVEGGDEVSRGTVVVRMADPDEFQVDILVSEVDISQVEVGASATVEVDATSMTYTATVTSIAPTATIQSGVVNYAVTVELESVEDIQSRQQTFEGTEDGEMPEMPESGDFSPPEDAELPEGMELPEDGEFGGFPGGGQSEGQLPATTSTDYQLLQGLSVTVSIVISQATDVICVPNGAVSSAGGQYYVEVVSESGETEQRAVQTGISDWQYTEITDGLSEGEQIVVPEGTTTTTTTESEWGGRSNGGMMMPGGF